MSELSARASIWIGDPESIYNGVRLLKTTQPQEIRRLQEKAREIRHFLLDITNSAGNAHIGGALSACDALVALYDRYLHFSKELANTPQRDRFILSKGHCGDALFCILSDLGFYSREDLVREFRHKDGRWGEHPNRLHNPGIEVSTGSLGHGLPLAIGMAQAGRIDGAAYRVFCMTGDGELQEGSNWESIMFAGQQKYGNLVLLIDQNGGQGTRRTEELMCDRLLPERMASFGWDVRAVDGNNMAALCEVFDALEPADGTVRRAPVCIILQTKKGKGVDFFESDPANCHAATLKDDRLTAAHRSVDAEFEKLETTGGAQG